MFCPECGEKLPDEANFCRACGSATGAVSYEEGPFVNVFGREVEKAYFNQVVTGYVVLVILVFALVLINVLYQTGVAWGIVATFTFIPVIIFLMIRYRYLGRSVRVYWRWNFKYSLIFIGRLMEEIGLLMRR